MKVGEEENEDAGGEDEKKRQKRGGKGMMKAKKTKEDGPKKVCVSRAPRGKKKSVTVVTGLSSFGKYLFIGTSNKLKFLKIIGIFTYDCFSL